MDSSDAHQLSGQRQQHTTMMQQQTQQVPPSAVYSTFPAHAMSNGQQGYMTHLDATTAALLMNPHTAAAVAAVAAAAAQQMQHAQHMHHQQQHANTQHVQQLQQSATHQHNFQIMTALPLGMQHAINSANAPSPGTAPGTISCAPVPHPGSAPPSSTPPSPQPGQQQVSQNQSLTNSASKVQRPGQHYTLGVPHHVAAMMGFPPGTNPGRFPPGVTIPLSLTGAPVPQHTVQITFPTSAASNQPSLTGPAQPPLPINPVAVAAAATQVLVQQQAVSSQYSNAAVLANMQNWKLDQLENQVSILQENKQLIPQPVAMLLADARRTEDKRNAKRVANRKSACTSRARKKALVEEMTKTNARLRRQALILALLPDLVIAITVEGEITFCSAQVERVLRHPIDDLLGANLADVLVPASREALNKLIGGLVAAERAASSGEANAERQTEGTAEDVAGDDGGKVNNGKKLNVNANGSAQSSNVSELVSTGAAVVSDQSFPLSVVKVKKSQGSGGEENSDLSTSNNGGGKAGATTGLKNASEVNTFSSQNGEAQLEEKGDSKISSKSMKGQKESSSDDSFSSSSDAKQIRKANENLSRNVRWHNEQMNKKVKAKRAHMDDVLGAFVTANNAGARLSSLQHRPFEPQPKNARTETEEDSSSSSGSLIEETKTKKSQVQRGHDQNSSDDSGYRESNESAREDTSSTESESSSNSPHEGRPRPLAPTCNICLIRDDLTTIWCEVTSSIRTRSLREEIAPEDAELFGGLGKSTTGSSEKDNSKTDPGSLVASSDSTVESTKDEIKELLLCLRPIRDGDEVVSEGLRFIPIAARAAQSGISDSTNAITATTSALSRTSDSTNAITNGGSTPRASSSSNGESASRPFGSSPPAKKRPPKKRPMSATKVSTGSWSHESSSEARPEKKARNEEELAEKSVVESLMWMSNNAT